MTHIGDTNKIMYLSIGGGGGARSLAAMRSKLHPFTTLHTTVQPPSARSHHCHQCAECHGEHTPDCWLVPDGVLLQPQTSRPTDKGGTERAQPKFQSQ